MHKLCKYGLHYLQFLSKKIIRTIKISFATIQFSSIYSIEYFVKTYLQKWLINPLKNKSSQLQNLFNSSILKTNFLQTETQ